MVDQSSRSPILGLAVRVVSLGEDDDALPWDLMLLQELAQDHLGFACRVHIGGVEGLKHTASAYESRTCITWG